MHEMSAADRQLTKSGRGCPACKGEPVYDCELEDPTINCPHLESFIPPGEKPSKYWCKYAGKCGHKVRRNIDKLDALRTWLNSSDEDPIAIISRMMWL